jgi:predicted nucleotidyltransferase component of viral defense system
VKTEFGLRRGRVRRRRLKVEERSESVVFRERDKGSFYPIPMFDKVWKMRSPKIEE